MPLGTHYSKLLPTRVHMCPESSRYKRTSSWNFLSYKRSVSVGAMAVLTPYISRDFDTSFPSCSLCTIFSISSLFSLVWWRTLALLDSTSIIRDEPDIYRLLRSTKTEIKTTWKILLIIVTIMK